jgi:cobalt-zinc-cadmium efflux system membrane fusion protein
MTSMQRAVAGMLLFALGCSGSGNGGKAADSADMPGMDKGDSTAKPASELMLSAAQIQHGGIRWAPAASIVASGVTSAAALPGQLVPNEDRTARLGAPAQGRVLAVRVSPGERVAAGRILVTLQSPDAGIAQSDLAKATAAMASRRAQAAYARSARERAERLLALKAIPRQDYEKAIAEDELARSELSQAEAELDRARSTARALGAEGQPAGQLALRAPAAGVVLERLAIPGAVVEPGALLLVITDPGTLWLTLNAPEALAGGLRLGTALRFVVPAFPAETLSARVSAVGAGLDPATRTLAARATVPNPRGRLKPAMLATVLLPASAGDPSARHVIILPDSAVQIVDGAPTVFIAMPDDKGGAHLMARRVELGARSGNQVVILSGISAGDLVVVAGAFAVKAELKKASTQKMVM